MTEKQLKELIREEYHNVKNFMEEKYGFVPELGQVVDNPYISAFKVEDYLDESTDEALSDYEKKGAKYDKIYKNYKYKKKSKKNEVIDEYDVETIEETKDFINFMKEYKSDVNEAEYQGRDVKLGKPMQGDVKKFKVYVKNDKGNVVKVNFGAKGMNIKKNNPERRKSFRARHNCDNPGPRWKARYWSCRKW